MFSLWGLRGCFAPKTLVRGFGLASLGSLLLVPQAGGADVPGVPGDGVTPYSLSGLLEMREGCGNPSRSTDRAFLVSFSEREHT